MDPQVIILAAGASSRFFPFNNLHKSLRVICGRPILYHTLESIKQSGLKNVVIVHNFSEDILKDIKNQNFGLSLQFTRQPEPKGQGDAVLCARELINGPFFIINANEINFHHHKDQLVDKFKSENAGITTLREQTDTPEKYGIYELDGDRVIRLVEKPSRESAPSNWRNIVIYFAKPEFLDTLASIKPSDSHLEEAVSQYASKEPVFALETSAPSTSIKYPWDLLNIKDIILHNLKPNISKSATIADTAIIRGDVTIEAGAVVGDFAIIEGPAYIGKDALVGTYSQLRAGSVLEAGAQAQRYCDIRGSIIGPNTHVHSQFIGDSILGSNIRIGAGFVTANKRIDRSNIKVLVKDQLVDSHRNNLGVLIGDDAQIGVNVAVMPGTVIGPKSVVYPGITVKGTNLENSRITNSNL